VRKVRVEGDERVRLESCRDVPARVPDMGALDDARSHLAKAREFVEAAEVTLDLGLFDAAGSSAVSSGINSATAVVRS